MGINYSKLQVQSIALNSDTTPRFWAVIKKYRSLLKSYITLKIFPEIWEIYSKSGNVTRRQSRKIHVLTVEPWPLVEGPLWAMMLITTSGEFQVTPPRGGGYCIIMTTLNTSNVTLLVLTVPRLPPKKHFRFRSVVNQCFYSDNSAAWNVIRKCPSFKQIINCCKSTFYFDLPCTLICNFPPICYHNFPISNCH